MTVEHPSITTPGPCGGRGKGVTQAWMSAPAADEVIVEPIDAAAVRLCRLFSSLGGGSAWCPGSGQGSGLSNLDGRI